MKSPPGSFGARPCRKIRERLLRDGEAALPKGWRKGWIIARIRATPLWADFVAIKAIYEEARRRQIETGVPHEVDHEIPLQHPRVCGLHVPGNLVPRTRKQNQAKKNYWNPDQLELVFPLSAEEQRRLRLQERIRRNSVVDPETGCWRWTGRKTNPKRGVKRARYPLITMRMPGYATPRTLIASRVSLEVFVGPPPTPAHEAAHDPMRCPHADCVNYAHLRWASREENEADKRHPSRLRVREMWPPTHRLAAIDEPAEVPF
jgi:hypothetical protein